MLLPGYIDVMLMVPAPLALDGLVYLTRYGIDDDHGCPFSFINQAQNVLRSTVCCCREQATRWVSTMSSMVTMVMVLFPMLQPSTTRFFFCRAGVAVDCRCVHLYPKPLSYSLTCPNPCAPCLSVCCTQPNAAPPRLTLLSPTPAELVSPVAAELRALVLARNRHATGMAKIGRVGLVGGGEGGRGARGGAALPAVIRRPRECGTCFQNSECMLYHRAAEGGDEESSGLERGVFDSKARVCSLSARDLGLLQARGVVVIVACSSWFAGWLCWGFVFLWRVGFLAMAGWFTCGKDLRFQTVQLRSMSTAGLHVCALYPCKVSVLPTESCVYRYSIVGLMRRELVPNFFVGNGANAL